MTNILTQKSLKYFEWIVQAPSSQDTRVTSKNFLFQEHKCNLAFYSGLRRSLRPAHLTFKSCGELLRPVAVAIFVDFGSETSHASCLLEDEDETIWRNENEVAITSTRLTFKVIFHTDYSTGISADKCVQTPSYIDTNLLPEDVSNNFSTLFYEGPDHDVEFICKDETIKAHKNILCCRSKVFASMFQTDMIEGKTGQVKILDVEGTVFSQFLRYVYTGVLPELTGETALRFYEIADKYAIDALKKQCASFLTENISLENACELLLVADRYNDPDFKIHVMEYMMKNKIPRIGKKWFDFCKEYPALALEVFNSPFHYFNTE